MAPIALKKLTALQTAREAEIESIRTRLLAKQRDSLNKSMVQARLDAVKQIWVETRKTHSEIVVRDDAETDAYIADQWFDRIQGVYESALDEILTLLALFDKPDADDSASMGESDSDPEVVKLPKISLPTFSGKDEDWASFSDLFTSLVHSRSGISDVTKLQYLKLCLTGVAAELIKDVMTTNANYASTWQTLKDRYSNPRLTINKLLTSFLEIPQMKKESAAEMRAFADEAKRIVRALTNLKLPVDHWDIWFVFLLSDRLDPESRKLWEAELSEKDQEYVPEADEPERDINSALPKFSDLLKFLERRAQALKMYPSERKAEKRPASTPTSGPQPRKVFHARSSRLSGNSNCALCNGTHPLSKCFKLKDKNPHERLATVKQLQRCFNCLGSHRANACNSSGRCSTCQGKHHTLLHLKFQGNSQAGHQNTDNSQAGGSGSKSVVSLHAAGVTFPKRRIVLATAKVQIIGPRGDRTLVRALLDQGSEASFVSESIVQLLGLRKEHTCVPLTGLGASAAGTARSRTQLVLKSRVDTSFQITTEALILPRLTSQLPVDSIEDLDLMQFAGLTLADPEFFLSNKVDVILGADVYGQLLRSGLRRFPSSQLVAQDTAFGWIMSGVLPAKDSRRAESHTSTPLQVLHCASMQELDQLLQRFWAFDELPSSFSKLKPEDEACEKLFKETHTRDSQGRYEVRLPLKSQLPSVAGETRQMALGSLQSLHRRFARDPKVAHTYREFLKEYEDLGHMVRVPESEIRREGAWYLPHHPVVLYLLLKMKIRVVFDASRRTRDADIVKMFRQIKVQREYQDFQRIVWAPTADSPPVDYRLTTVTYGTTYVDDTFAGSDELSTAVQKRVELTKLLGSAGIYLDKWAVNHPELLPPQTGQGPAKEIDMDESVKTLGVHWNPAQDKFGFSVSDITELSKASTKRSILSNIARLFDPLGWLSPVTVTAKVLMQDLWIQKCDWDTPLPEDFRERWYAYCKSLSELPSLSIDRWLGVTSTRSYQLHGFSDASSRAYAAAVYLRVDKGDGTFSVSLLAAKTKVSPVKTVSIPNLELCGAALLVKLLCHVRKLDFLSATPVFAWSDSQIVLTWLRKHPCHWKTFVANRVSYIQTELPSATWAHVPTKENPADLATRGSGPAELAGTTLWWQGPSWLSQAPNEWPQPAETRRALHTKKVPSEPELLTRFSSLSRLIRVVAFARRPILNHRRQKEAQEPLPEFLTLSELAEARSIVIRLSQASSFAVEIEALKAGGRLPKGNRLSKLNPFIGKDNILRVGGRLSHSSLSFDRKHPPILSQDSALSRLFVYSAHRLCLHGGPTLTSSVLMQQVWIVGRKQLVKSMIHKCVTCQRVKPQSAQQLMGDLPADRVHASRPFLISGLDYAGPIQKNHEESKRNNKAMEAIALGKGLYLKPYKNFHDVFMRNNLLSDDPLHNESAVVNLDDFQNRGTHWVCYCKRGPEVIYFDSFGDLKPPNDLMFWETIKEVLTDKWNHYLPISHGR
ncbi:uncharacterized protein LOC103316074 [Nasonia vitripennis]|uniref:Integrase zinc-binding domain-containing protein n=1 Tax=Nasonia vitripennis TaxID=7425 RepID=A0A7M7Q5G9_NASVI|nr:uncharacterized protein LOC103316074 [Nasonia vitripennis]